MRVSAALRTGSGSRPLLPTPGTDPKGPPGVGLCLHTRGLPCPPAQKTLRPHQMRVMMAGTPSLPEFLLCSAQVFTHRRFC